MNRTAFLCCLTAAICATAFALEPDEILILANADNPDSLQIADYYCLKRSVPRENILKLSLGRRLADTISRRDYDAHIARPVRETLREAGFSGTIKCLLTVYGVPFKAGPREPLGDESEQLSSLLRLLETKTRQLSTLTDELERLGGPKNNTFYAFASPEAARKIIRRLESDFNKTLSAVNNIKDRSRKRRLLAEWIRLYQAAFGKVRAAQKASRTDGVNLRMTAADRLLAGDINRLVAQANREKWDCRRKLDSGLYDRLESVAGSAGVAAVLLADIDRIKGTGTGASVDSELSMLMFDDYQLYRWQPNELKQRVLWIGTRTLMVSRLDGPDSRIARGLIDKAIAAEKNGLRGNACFDWRWGQGGDSGSEYARYDASIRKTAKLVARRTDLTVLSESTSALFAPGDCPRTALYCGWYSLRKYIDAFDFVDGAVGFHIASFEAVNLRDRTSSQWCPAMLADGITATLGSVAEPYLGAFPKPDEFFEQLVNGRCLVEAYYRTKPYNSWQMLLIGDPLYTPFSPAG